MIDIAIQEAISQINIVQIGIFIMMAGFMIWFRSLMYSCGGGFRDCGLCIVPILFWGGITSMVVGFATVIVGGFFL